jgi:hypothetical protein
MDGPFNERFMLICEHNEHNEASASHEVWGKLHNAISADGVRSTWYMVTHGIAPTNGRLHKILLIVTHSCTHCQRKGNMLRPIPNEGERREIWSRLRIALTENQPATYTQGIASLSLFQNIRQTFGSLQAWILCDKSAQDLYVPDYIDFTRRTRWKICQCRKRMQLFW